MKRTILLIISCFVLLNYVSAKSFKDKSDIVKEIDSNEVLSMMELISY